MGSRSLLIRSSSPEQTSRCDGTGNQSFWVEPRCFRSVPHRAGHGTDFEIRAAWRPFSESCEGTKAESPFRASEGKGPRFKCSFQWAGNWRTRHPRRRGSSRFTPRSEDFGCRISGEPRMFASFGSGAQYTRNPKSEILFVARPPSRSLQPHSGSGSSPVAALGLRPPRSVEDRDRGSTAHPRTWARTRMDKRRR